MPIHGIIVYLTRAQIRFTHARSGKCFLYLYISFVGRVYSFCVDFERLGRAVSNILLLFILDLYTI